MAQKVIICECNDGADVMQRADIAALVADGWVVTGLSACVSRDYQPCVALMLEGGGDGGGPTTVTKGDLTAVAASIDALTDAISSDVAERRLARANSGGE